MGQKKKALNDYYEGLSLSPNHPSILCKLGDFYYQTPDNSHQAFQFYQKAADALETLSQQSMNKLKFGQHHKNYITARVALLKEIEQNISESKVIIQNLPTETQDQCLEQLEQSQILEKIQIEIDPILSISNIETKKGEEYQAQNEKLNQILNQIILCVKQLNQCQVQLKQQYQYLEKHVNILIEQDRYKVHQLLINLDKLENQNQQIYYKSLFWRLYYYLKAIQLLSTDLFLKNTNAIIETNSEKVLNIVQNITNIGSVICGPIPVIGDVFQMINSALDYAINKKNELKFNNRVKILSEILIQFALNPQQLEIQVQMAAIILAKLQLNIKQRRKTIFSDRVDKILERESSFSQLSKDIYWINGTEDSLIILSYLERNQKKILKEENKKLSQIIEDAVKSYSYPSKVQQINTGDSKTCQMI